jgi:hypothetical protein
MINPNDYSFKRHLHNYSIWTAARAVQRSFTSTKKIKNAIDGSALQQFADDDKIITESDFEQFHRVCANRIINLLTQDDVSNATYGRAAKIIAIYLKTSVIIPNKGQCQRSNIIHPPIDGILLTALAADLGCTNIKFMPWTQLTETDYWSLVSQIKAIPRSFDWRLEKYWTPET